MAKKDVEKLAEIEALLREGKPHAANGIACKLRISDRRAQVEAVYQKVEAESGQMLQRYWFP